MADKLGIVYVVSRELVLVFYEFSTVCYIPPKTLLSKQSLMYQYVTVRPDR